MSHAALRALATGLLLATWSSARAQSLGEAPQDPRNLGRANTSTVSGDSGMALLINPGGMVRRSQPRLVLGTAVRDDDGEFAAERSDAPTISNRAGPVMAPLVAYHQGNRRGTWVVGALVLRDHSQTTLAEPAFGQPAADVERLFPHRYGGTQWSANWQRYAVGAAVRIGDAVGLGVSFSISRFEMRERARMWAGFDGRDPLLSAGRDLSYELSGADSFVPGASVGALVAPPSVPLELALAVELRQGARLGGGRVDVARTTANAFPQPAGRGTATLDMPDLLIARSGLRYLGRRFFAEASATLYAVGKGQEPGWKVDGLRVIDDSGVEADIDQLPSLFHTGSFASLSASSDLELVPGFLWLTSGYRCTSPASPTGMRRPAFARLGGHTLAVGLEAAHENYLITMGYARRLERERRLDSEQSEAAVYNPFDAGTAASNSGRYRRSADQLGFALEVSWD